MGHVVTTPAGSFRANWRDPAGRQRAKTFPTKKAAKAFLTEVESAKNRGSYVDPGAGRMPFTEHAARWMAGRSIETTTSAASRSRLRARILPHCKLRFHDLRHCYATWMISRGVPVNVVQRVLGHERASTTLNRYTHTPDDYLQQVRRAFDRGPADFSLTSELPASPKAGEGLPREAF
jgi:integrase